MLWFVFNEACTTMTNGWNRTIAITLNLQVYWAVLFHQIWHLNQRHYWLQMVVVVVLDNLLVMDNLLVVEGPKMFFKKVTICTYRKEGYVKNFTKVVCSIKLNLIYWYICICFARTSMLIFTHLKCVRSLIPYYMYYLLIKQETAFLVLT